MYVLCVCVCVCVRVCVCRVVPGTPTNSSMKRTYFWAFSGSSVKLLAAEMSLFQPGSVSYCTSTRCNTS